MSLDVQPPVCLTKPLVVPNKLMMGPGPSNCSPRVLHGMGYPVLGHLHAETLQIMDDVKDGIKYMFQTRNPLTLCVSGTGHAGMEAALNNTLEPGSKALIPTNGIWGCRAADMAQRCGATVIKLEGTPGKSFAIKELKNAIESHRPDVLFITHGESSTGVLQPLEGLGDICHKYNCLLVVDSVASCGGTPLFMDKWGIDVLYTGSQKVLGVPPGITPISFSPLAERRLFSRKSPVSCYYWDMKLLGQYWGCFEGKPRIYHHTVPASLLYGLREGLAQICEETLPKSWQRHEQCAKHLTDGLTELGLQMYVQASSDRLPTVTAVCLPQMLDWKKVISYAMDKHSLEISAGLGPTSGVAVRIGVMGYNATPENVERTLSVLDEAIKYVKSTATEV
ncbi:Alanine-glyoxylate aminotransferase [Carabus blaptoides fortunei]